MCQRCGLKSDKLHQNHRQIIKDLNWGEQSVFLEINRRQFNCEKCQKVNTSDLQAVQARAVAYAQMQREHQELKRRLKLVAQKRDELEQKLEMTQEKLAVQQQIDLVLSDPQALVSLGQIACELRLPPRQIDEDIPALDLVMNTRQTDLVGATQWLNQRFGAATTIGLVNDRVRQIVTEQILDRFIPPRPERDKWGEVKDYLISTKQLPTKLVDRLHEERLIYADKDGKLICLHRDFEQRVTGATAIDLKDEQLQKLLVEGSSLTSGFHYFERDPLVDTERVVICDDPIEAMAYATLHLPARPTLYLSAHDGGFVPGNKLSAIEIIVACDIELQNLPARFDRHLPIEDSWISDLKSELASLTSGQIQIGERDDKQIRVIQEIQQKLLGSAQQHNSQKNPPLDRNLGGR